MDGFLIEAKRSSGLITMLLKRVQPKMQQTVTFIAYCVGCPELFYTPGIYKRALQARPVNLG